MPKKKMGDEASFRLADESAKTKKAREKLKKKFESIDKKITTKALERKNLEIHRWIARHAQHRVVLKTKAISLFDENQNTAKTSQRIGALMENLRSGFKEKV